eukprot:5519270-Pyramimonas_sp.AAC.1
MSWSCCTYCERAAFHSKGSTEDQSLVWAGVTTTGITTALTFLNWFAGVRTRQRCPDDFLQSRTQESSSSVKE